MTGWGAHCISLATGQAPVTPDPWKSTPRALELWGRGTSSNLKPKTTLPACLQVSYSSQGEETDRTGSRGCSLTESPVMPGASSAPEYFQHASFHPSARLSWVFYHDPQGHGLYTKAERLVFIGFIVYPLYYVDSLPSSHPIPPLRKRIQFLQKAAYKVYAEKVNHSQHQHPSLLCTKLCGREGYHLPTSPDVPPSTGRVRERSFSPQRPETVHGKRESQGTCEKPRETEREHLPSTGF